MGTCRRDRRSHRRRSRSRGSPGSPRRRLCRGSDRRRRGCRRDRDRPPAAAARSARSRCRRRRARRRRLRAFGVDDDGHLVLDAGARRRDVLDAEDGARAIGHTVAVRQAEVDGGVELEAEARAPAHAERELGRRFGRGQRRAGRILEPDEAAQLRDGSETERQRHRGGHAVLELRADVQVAEVAAAARDEARVHAPLAGSASATRRPGGSVR